MKTKITLVVALLGLIFTSNAQSKVGTVDSDLVIAKMPQMTSVQDRLKTYGAKLDSINAIKIAEYDAKVKIFNADKTSHDSIKKKNFAEINTLNQDIAKFRQNGNKLMQLRRDEYMRPLYKRVTEVVAEVSKEHGYTQILTTQGNQFAYIDEKFDITKLVLAKLGINE